MTSTAQNVTQDGQRRVPDELEASSVPKSLLRLLLPGLPTPEEIVEGDRVFHEKNAIAKPPYTCTKRSRLAPFMAWLLDSIGLYTPEHIEVYPKRWNSELCYWQTRIDEYDCIFQKCPGGGHGFSVYFGSATRKAWIRLL